MLCDNPEGWGGREVQEGGDICILMADSRCCVAETKTTLSFRILGSSVGIPSPPLALFIVMLPKAHLTPHSRMSGSR